MSDSQFTQVLERLDKLGGEVKDLNLLEEFAYYGLVDSVTTIVLCGILLFMMVYGSYKARKVYKKNEYDNDGFVFISAVLAGLSVVPFIGLIIAIPQLFTVIFSPTVYAVKQIVSMVTQ